MRNHLIASDSRSPRFKIMFVPQRGGDRSVGAKKRGARTSGVDAEAEMNGKASALREHEEYRQEHRR